MVSVGTEYCLARSTAACSVMSFSGLDVPPSRAADSTPRISLAKSLPRRASVAAFLCLIEDHLECPDIRGDSSHDGAKRLALTGRHEHVLRGAEGVDAVGDLGAVDVPDVLGDLGEG